MTNAEFWSSISKIISQGFTVEGLSKLDDYAERFISGRIIYKRFSPQEQHGCSAGGSSHVIASLLSAAEIGADKLSAPVGSFKREKQCAEEQERRIEAWARKSGCWFDGIDEMLTRQFGSFIAEGGEARVYDNGPTLIKIIGLDYYIQPILALDRISLHNAWFPETRLLVLGFGRTRQGEFVILVEQPYITGSQIEQGEITNFALQLGFKELNPKNWTYATPDIYLSDLHDENVLKSSQGNIFVIDCDIRINTPELKCNGVRQLTTEIIIY